MARSTYIYLVRSTLSGNVLGSFTVKQEAVHELRKAGLSVADVVLHRRRDGQIDTDETLIDDWDE